MRLKINRKTFIEALMVGGAMSNKKHTAPILEFAKVRVDEKQLVVSSSDNEIYITKRVFVDECDDEREFCISSSDLIKALKSIKEECVVSYIEDNTIRICHTYGEMKFPVIPADDFPILMKSETSESLDVNCERIYDLFDKGKNFICEEKGRSISGLCVYAKEGRHGVCCSNFDKLFTDTFETESGDTSSNIVIPTNAIQPILNTIYGYDLVTVVLEERNVTFKVKDARINCRVLDVNYPIFERIIPKDNNNDVIVDRDIILEAVNRAKMFANSSRGFPLTINVSGETMTISAYDMGTNKESKESILVSHSTEDISVTLNGAGLALCLSNIESESVRIKMKAADKAVVFKDMNNPDRYIVQMPIAQR